MCYRWFLCWATLVNPHYWPHRARSLGWFPSTLLFSTTAKWIYGEKAQTETPFLRIFCSRRGVFLWCHRVVKIQPSHTYKNTQRHDAINQIYGAWIYVVLPCVAGVVFVLLFIPLCCLRSLWSGRDIKMSREVDLSGVSGDDGWSLWAPHADSCNTFMETLSDRRGSLQNMGIFTRWRHIKISRVGGIRRT